MTTNREIIRQANIDRNRAYDKMQRTARTIKNVDAKLKRAKGERRVQLLEVIEIHSATYQAAWDAYCEADRRIKEAA